MLVGVSCRGGSLCSWQENIYVAPLPLSGPHPGAKSVVGAHRPVSGGPRIGWAHTAFR